MELVTIDKALIENIRGLLNNARARVSSFVNVELLSTYFEIGKMIVEYESKHPNQHGKGGLLNISKALTKEFGKGFSRTNIHYMKSFYLYKQNFQTASENLSWSHYCEILDISDTHARNFYEKECGNSGWSFRELKRQVESSLFERLLLISGKDKQQKLLTLSQAGQILQNPQDIIKEPYVFEFLGLPEKILIKETKLEKMLGERMKDFMLELGKGFMYVGSQQRITLGNTHNYVDLVFYNKILKAYVLIDLKTRKFKHENIGQMNTYLNYYETEINEQDDTKPIGIILCADRNEIEVEYAISGVSSQIFTSKYTFVLPDKEKLIAELSKTIKK